MRYKAVGVLFALLCAAEATAEGLERLGARGLPVELPTWSAMVFDLDGDGVDEFTSVTHGLQPPWLQLRDGVFVDEGGGPFQGLGADRHGMVPCDVDRDGRFELAVAHGGGRGTGGRAFALHFQLPNGIWTDIGPEQLESTVNTRMRGVNCVDLDADGVPELYVSAFKNVKPDLLLAFRDGQWVDEAQRWNLATAGTVLGSVFGDVDGDGDVDVVRFNVTDTQLLLQEDGRFVNAEARLGYTDVKDIELSDLDGDGDLDLYLARAIYTYDLASLNGARFVLEEGDDRDTARWHVGDCREIEVATQGNLGGGSKIRTSRQERLNVTIRPREHSYEDPGGEGLVAYMRNKNLIVQGRNVVGASNISIRCNEGEGLRFNDSNLDPWDHQEPRDLLLLNRGDGTFMERQLPPGAGLGSTSDVLAWDYDLDGDQDLLLITGPTPGTMENAPDELLRNDGEQGFTLVDWPENTPFLGHLGLPADLDGDLYPELITFNGGYIGVMAGHTQLWDNPGGDNQAVRVQVFDAGGAARSLGARIRVSSRDHAETRLSDPTRDYRTANNLYDVFGVGTARMVDVDVQWADGETSRQKVRAGEVARFVHP